MIQFISLNTLITDLLNIIRGSKVSQSETISRRQIEDWIHQYRALLLKQEMDKGKMPNPDYIQELPSIKLEVVDKSLESDLQSEMNYMRTELEIPTTIDINHKSGIMYVGTIDGREIQLVQEGRNYWQQFKRFTKNVPLAFLRNQRIYINIVTPLKYVTIRGIFEIPTEASNFNNPSAITSYSSLDDRYPIPSNLVPVLKAMILERECGIIVSSPSDNSNDSVNLMSQNADQKGA